MPRRRHTSEQIIHLLREAEVLQSQGVSISELSKKLGITDQTYYRWRKEYGGLRVDQAKRLKELEKENSRLKRVVGEQALDIAILKEAASGNF
jgi:transposase-like protein